MVKINRVAGVALSMLLLGASGVMALGHGPKPSTPLPTYHQMVENEAARSQYIAAAWSRLGQLEKENARNVHVTVTLQHSLSPSAAEELAQGLGLKLIAWDAMVGKGTVHRYTAGRITDDVADVVQRLQKDVDPNLTTGDIKVVALFGTIDPANAMKARTSLSVLAIDPAGDKRVSGREKSRLAPHLFWTLPDYRSK